MESRLVQKFDDDYMFISNSDDIIETLKMKGITNDVITRNTFLITDIYDVGSIFVKQFDGEIEEIWVHPQDIPFIYLRYDRVF